MMVSDRTELIFSKYKFRSELVVNWDDLDKSGDILFVMIEGMGADTSWIETKR